MAVIQASGGYYLAKVGRINYTEENSEAHHLVSDFVAYCLFAFACFRTPESLSVFVHILRHVYSKLRS